MRSFVLCVGSIIGVVSAVCITATLGACTQDAPVTDRHIRLATEKCEVNGGLKQFEHATVVPAYEGCGYRCSRKTGVVDYSAAFICKNGAKFDLSWQE